MFIQFTQLFLDGLHLLPEIVFPLGLIHVLLHLRLDLIAQFQNLNLPVQEQVNLVEPLMDINHLQESLFFRCVNVQVRGNEVGQNGGRFNITDHRPQFGGEVGCVFNGFLEKAFQVHHHRIDFDTLDRFLFNHLDPRLIIGIPLNKFMYSYP